MRYVTWFAVLLIATAAFSQPPSEQQTQIAAQSYAPYSIALLPDAPGGEVVFPLLTTEGKILFVKSTELQKASQEKRLIGRPVTYGELLALIGQLQIEVNHLKQENEKLWAAVGKPAPQTIVVQPPQTEAQQSTPATAPQQNDDALMKYMLLRQLFPSSRPYQIPLPTPHNNGVNCTTNRIGNTAYTNCR